MSQAEDTCWTLIEKAALGGADARAIFSRTYLDVVRAFLLSRWRGTRYADRAEDAVQDVFLELFRPAGALARISRNKGSEFKTWLFAVVRNVALRHEERARVAAASGAAQPAVELARLPDDEASLSVAFDREWARAILARAAERQRAWALAEGEAGRRRVELLDLRLAEGLPIREIARRWDTDAAELHAAYRRARDEFRRALREELRFHHPEPGVDLDAECQRVLALFQGP